MKTVEIGEIIKAVIEQRKAETGLTYEKIANRLGRTRANLYRIIRTNYVDLDTLVRLGNILEHNFLKHFLDNDELEEICTEYADEFDLISKDKLEELKKDNGHLVLENSYLKKIIKLYEEKKIM